MTFTHGYTELPADLKVVVLELAANARELPSGTATSFSTPGYGITFGATGLTISDDQKVRLAPFKIGWVG